MTIKRGEVWLADLNPTRGSEQAGTRPILILQNNRINRFSRTFLAIPFTSNLRRALLPTCVLINKGEGGLASDSVRSPSIESTGQIEIKASSRPDRR